MIPTTGLPTVQVMQLISNYDGIGVNPATGVPTSEEAWPTILTRPDILPLAGYI